MPDGRIIRYSPVGKTNVIGLRVYDSNPIIRYSTGISSCGIPNPKLINSTLTIKACIGCPICISIDGGGRTDESEFVYDGNGDGKQIDAGNSTTILCD